MSNGATRGEAYNSRHQRVGEGLKRDMQPACYNSLTPEIWFADEPPRKPTEQAYKEKEALVALRICAECPIQQACLNYAMTDADAIFHGIWGGTFAFERLNRDYKGHSLRSAFQYQKRLRQKFMKEGLTCPPIPQDLYPATLDNVTRKRREKVRELTEQGKMPKEIAQILGEPVALVRGDRSVILHGVRKRKPR